MTAIAATSVAEADLIELIIQPQRGWIAIDWGELSRFRELLYFLVWRDVKVRYKQTALGIAWAVLVPLTQMLVFTGVLGGLAGITDRLPRDLQDKYAVYLFAGQLPWFFFAAAAGSGGLSLLNSQHLLTKIYFPRLFIPTAVVCGALVDMLFSAIVYAVILAWFHIVPSWQMVFLPPLLLLLILAGLASAYVLSALTVSYRDFRFIIPFLVQTWMFASPVLYPLPSHKRLWVQWLFNANPLNGIIDGFRTCVLGPERFPWNFPELSWSIAAVCIALLYGLFYFRKTERRFADIA